VNGIRVQEFLDRPDLSRLGLGERNRGMIEIWPSEKRPSVTLVLGEKIKDKGQIYLRRKDQPFAVSVVDHFDKDTDKKWADFRDRNLMRFDAPEAVRLKVSKPGASLVYEKNPDGVWLCPGRSQANDEAARIVDALASTRVQAFVEGISAGDAGTVHPPQAAVVNLKDGKIREFRFGRRRDDKILVATPAGRGHFLVFPNAANQIENVLTGITASGTPRP